MWLQIRMRDLARQAPTVPLSAVPPLALRLDLAALGVPAFVSVLVISYLMVAKSA